MISLHEIINFSKLKKNKEILEEEMLKFKTS